VREGHSVGNHSQTHPRYFDRLTQEQAVKEIQDAATNIRAALEPAGLNMAPFFRFPGFRHVEAMDQYLNQQGYVVIGADFPADDWMFITPDTVLKRAMDRLEKRGSGILLLHDIHPRTVTILPSLLQELKARGYTVVEMVPPSGSEAPVAAVPAPSPPLIESASKETDQLHASNEQHRHTARRPTHATVKALTPHNLRDSPG
jgi:hypothetical protein